MQQHRAKPAPDYRDDFYAWTQHQAKLLRVLEKVTFDRPEGLDIENLAEEVEGLGSADLNTVKSLVRQILLHLLKAASDPRSTAMVHWKVEVATFRADARDRYSASMRQLIDMDVLWGQAFKLAELALEEPGATLPAHVPTRCPFSIEYVLSEDFSFDHALAKLQALIKAR